MQKNPGGLAETRDSKIPCLTIDRPADLNRLSPDLIDHLGVRLAELREDPDISVPVITGSGDDVFWMGLLNPATRASLSKDDVVRLVRRPPQTQSAEPARPSVPTAGSDCLGTFVRQR